MRSVFIVLKEAGDPEVWHWSIQSIHDSRDGAEAWINNYLKEGHPYVTRKQFKIEYWEVRP